MLSRREFAGVLGALPVVRLWPEIRMGCEHRWEGFKTVKSIGPVREWVLGAQCLDCGHIKVAERVTTIWGSLES